MKNPLNEEQLSLLSFIAYDFLEKRPSLFKLQKRPQNRFKRIWYRVKSMICILINKVDIPEKDLMGKIPSLTDDNPQLTVPNVVVWSRTSANSADTPGGISLWWSISVDAGIFKGWRARVTENWEYKVQ